MGEKRYVWIVHAWHDEDTIRDLWDERKTGGVDAIFSTEEKAQCYIEADIDALNRPIGYIKKRSRTEWVVDDCRHYRYHKLEVDLDEDWFGPFETSSKPEKI